MKFKMFISVLIIVLISIIAPSSVLAYENVSDFEYSNNHYELFDDGTAKLILADYWSQDVVSVNPFVEYNGEQYSVTSLGANALDNITGSVELELFMLDTPPSLDTDNPAEFFKNISVIYVPLGSKEYLTADKWPAEKLKTYQITQQPQDIIVTAGNITETDFLETVATIRADGGSLGYNWYECDKDGNIVSNESIYFGHEMKVPTDLSYDNENNTTKEYYYICAVGWEDDIIEYSRVVKVKVNPGAYKIKFHYDASPDGNTITFSVDNTRKLSSEDVAKIPTVDKLIKEGKEFVGWTIDKENIINPESLVYDKNVDIYPVWRTKLIFNANGGKFEDKEIVELYITNVNPNFDELSLPVRDGYMFVDFYDKNEGGNIINIYDIFLEDTTIYVGWKELSSSSEGMESPKEEINENPNTSDNIIITAVAMVLSVAGVIVCRYKLR